MSALWFRARSVVRRRWRVWASLGVVLGIFAGLTIALAVGAHNADVAYSRFVRVQKRADLVMAGKSEFGLVGSVDLDQVAQLPDVAYSAQAFVALFFSATVNGHGPALGASDMFPVAATDERVGTTIEKWKMLEGRRADSTRVDEATASFELARRLHIKVGDTVRFHFYDAASFIGVAAHLLQVWPERLAALRENGHTTVVDPANGPVVQVKVVGIEASPLEFPPLINDLAPVLHLTPAFSRAYSNRIAGSPIAYLRLRHPDQLPDFQLQVERLVPGQPVSFVSTLVNQQPKVQRSIRAEAIVLAILAALVAFAGAVALAQALYRQGLAESGDDQILSALGMRRGQLYGLALIRSAFIGVVAGAVACLVGWLVAPSISLSLTAKANLDHGFPVNASALAIGGWAVLAFVVVVGMTSAVLTTRSARRRARAAERPATGRGGFGDPLRRSWLPLPTVLGVRFTLQRARRSAPLWTAVAGIAFCIAMLTFASTFTSHLHRGLSEKHRYGWNWDVKIGAPALPDLDKPLLAGLRSQPGVTDLSEGFVTQMQVGPNSRVDVLALDPIVGDARPTILAGRPPATADEIALGSRTMRDLHTGLGRLIAGRIGSTKATYRVVGQAVFPEFGDSGQLGTGSLTTMAGVRRLLTSAPRDVFYVGMSGAPNVDARVATLTALLSPLPTRTEARPEDLVNLARGDGLLLLLGVLLAFLALAMLVHTLLTAVRDGRRGYATLQALGYSRRQSRLTILGQSMTIGFVSLVVGVPLGMALGRWTWSAYADHLGVATDSYLPYPPIGLAVAGTFVIVLLAAGPPSWTVTRTNVASALHPASE